MSKERGIFSKKILDDIPEYFSNIHFTNHRGDLVLKDVCDALQISGKLDLPVIEGNFTLMDLLNNKSINKKTKITLTRFGLLLHNVLDYFEISDERVTFGNSNYKMALFGKTKNKEDAFLFNDMDDNFVIRVGLESKYYEKGDSFEHKEKGKSYYTFYDSNGDIDLYHNKTVHIYQDTSRSFQDLCNGDYVLKCGYGCLGVFIGDMYDDKRFDNEKLVSIISNLSVPTNVVDLVGKIADRCVLQTPIDFSIAIRQSKSLGNIYSDDRSCSDYIDINDGKCIKYKITSNDSVLSWDESEKKLYQQVTDFFHYGVHEEEKKPISFEILAREENINNVPSTRVMYEKARQEHKFVKNKIKKICEKFNE